MKALFKILIYLTLVIIFISGILYLNYENYLTNRLEEAVLQGYPGTKEAKVHLDISSIKTVLKGNIDYCSIEIMDWHLDNWTISSFKGAFYGVKINMEHLLMQQIVVVESIEKGQITAVLGEENLSLALRRYYPGLDVELIEDKLAIGLDLELMGAKVYVVAQGSLEAQEGKLVYLPEKLSVSGYNLPKYLEQQVLKRLNLQVPLEEMPFPFKITTVNIRQRKIFIEGEV